MGIANNCWMESMDPEILWVIDCNLEKTEQILGAFQEIANNRCGIDRVGPHGNRTDEGRCSLDFGSHPACAREGRVAIAHSNPGSPHNGFLDVRPCRPHP